jgi:hypothetical protein
VSLAGDDVGCAPRVRLSHVAYGDNARTRDIDEIPDVNGAHSTHADKADA